MIDMFLKFNRTEQSLLLASATCFVITATVHPVMIRLGYPDALAVQVMIYFARTGGVVLFLALAMSMWRYMRPVRAGEEPGEGAWDPEQAPKMPKLASVGGKADASGEYELVLTEAGENKIEIIKLIREISGLGLKEAKDVSESTPAVVKTGLSKDAAKALVDRFETDGARARVNKR